MAYNQPSGYRIFARTTQRQQNSQGIQRVPLTHEFFTYSTDNSVDEFVPWRNNGTSAGRTGVVDTGSFNTSCNESVTSEQRPLQQLLRFRYHCMPTRGKLFATECLYIVVIYFVMYSHEYTWTVIYGYHYCAMCIAYDDFKPVICCSEFLQEMWPQDVDISKPCPNTNGG